MYEASSGVLFIMLHSTSGSEGSGKTLVDNVWSLHSTVYYLDINTVIP